MTDAALPPADRLERMYQVMVTAKLADERAKKETEAGRLAAAFYPVRGMEAVCAALGEVLEARDQLVSTYRNLGDALAKGVPLAPVVAELYGRADGVSGGKGGPMHLHDASTGLAATTGIVGSGLPIAAGLGIAAQLDGDGHIVAVTFGDGATSIGAYHEALNMAALWRLPVLFVCQNNQWAEHTPIAGYTAAPRLSQRAAAYGIEAHGVDGFDAVATWRTLRSAVDAVREGRGPVFVECVTYRLTGHTGTASYGYVPKQELDAALARDPAPAFRAWLAGDGHVDASRLDELDRAAAADVDEAFRRAASLPPPEPDRLYEDVFADKRLVPDLP